MGSLVRKVLPLLRKVPSSQISILILKSEYNPVSHSSSDYGCNISEGVLIDRDSLHFFNILGKGMWIYETFIYATNFLYEAITLYL